MPKKIAGSKRKELNEMRSADAMAGREEGILFARVVKLLGNGQVHVVISTERNGAKTLLVRLPRVFGKRGSTPLSTTNIVSIFVGVEFDPNKDLKPGTAVVTDYMFDITAILDDKSAQKLAADKIIPEWMIKSGTTDTKEITVDEGFVFGEESDEEEEEEMAPAAPVAAGGAGAPAVAAPRGTSGRDKATTSRLEVEESGETFTFE